MPHTAPHAPQDLEHREKQYDGREYLDIYTGDSDKEPALTHVLTFIATNTKANKQWLGPASMESVAQQIAYAAGPSGQNCQYLYYLADAMRKVNKKRLDRAAACNALLLSLYADCGVMSIKLSASVSSAQRSVEQCFV